MIDDKFETFGLLNSIYAHDWSLDRKLNNMSSYDMLSMSKIKELYLFTYSHIFSHRPFMPQPFQVFLSNLGRVVGQK
jgi:hypothetical protein